MLSSSNLFVIIKIKQKENVIFKKVITCKTESCFRKKVKFQKFNFYKKKEEKKIIVYK
jgi:hypothetical protein